MKSKYKIRIDPLSKPITWSSQGEIVYHHEIMYSIDKNIKRKKFNPSDTLCLICIEYPSKELRVPYLCPKKWSPKNCRYSVSARRTIMSKAYTSAVLEYFEFVPSELLFSDDERIRNLAKFLLEEE